jgi:hypothetical protein
MAVQIGDVVSNFTQDSTRGQIRLHQWMAGILRWRGAYRSPVRSVLPFVLSCLLLLVIAPQAAPWSWEANFLGVGSGTARLWCSPNTPPARGDREIAGPLPQEISTTAANLPAACDPVTFVRSDAGLGWRNLSAVSVARGDNADTPSLLPLVTPVSLYASGSVDISATMPDQTHVTFSVTWSGSDAGVAINLTWLDTSVSITNPTVLHQVTKVGPWSESFTLPFSSSNLANPGAALKDSITIKGAGAATSLPLPHFQCYEARRKPLDRAGVSLTDRFGSSTVTVNRAEQFCAPANKNGEDSTAVNEPAHLTSYTIKQTSPSFNRARATVTNQFGSLTLDVVKPDSLLVPTAKSLTSPPSRLEHPTDHFKCYTVKGASFRRDAVTVDTQFGPLTVDIKHPLHLCLPADKNGEGIINPDMSLLCYQARGSTPVGRPEVFTDNQFGQDKFALSGARELCVPSSVSVNRSACTFREIVDLHAGVDANGDYTTANECLISWGTGYGESATFNEPCATSTETKAEQCLAVQLVLQAPNRSFQSTCTGPDADTVCGLDSPSENAEGQSVAQAKTIDSYQWLTRRPVVGPSGVSSPAVPGTFSDNSYGCSPDRACTAVVGAIGYQEPSLGIDVNPTIPGFFECPGGAADFGTRCDLATGSTAGRTFDGQCDVDGTCNSYFGAPSRSGTPTTSDPEYREAMKQNNRGGNQANSLTVVIFGDSVNAKHHQAVSGNVCVAPQTTSDWRNLTGNDFPASPFGVMPAFNYTRALPLARTGWTSGDSMALNPNADTCGGTWIAAGTWTPEQVAETWAVQEPVKAKRIVIGDGGINDKDWSTSLGWLAACNLMQSFAAFYNADPTSSGRARLAIAVTPPPGIAARVGDLLKFGGTCTIMVTPTIRIVGNGVIGRLINGRAITVPAFEYTAAELAQIQANVAALKNAVTPWAGKLIWLRYYDIVTAQIDVRGGLPALVAANAGQWGWIAGPAAGLIPGRLIANTVNTVPFFSWAYIRTLRDQVNGAVFAGLGCPGAFGNPGGPTDCSGGAKTVLFTGVPAVWNANSMQRTVRGGMPHPSLIGAAQLGVTYDAGRALGR